jgi:uncharacterized membrane protein
MASQTTASGAETSTGLDENVAGALAYVLGLITGIAFLVLESDNRFVKFHAAQSIVFTLAVFGINVLLWIVGAVVGAVLGNLVGGLFGLLTLPLWLVFFAAWVFLMFQAFQGKEFEVPVVGGIARSIAA